MFDEHNTQLVTGPPDIAIQSPLLFTSNPSLVKAPDYLLDPPSDHLWVAGTTSTARPTKADGKRPLGDEDRLGDFYYLFISLELSVYQTADVTRSGS